MSLTDWPVALLLGALWFALGAAAFAYWWTRERDLTTDELSTLFMCGMAGPVLSFIVGWLVMGKPWIGKRVLWPRRGGARPR